MHSQKASGDFAEVAFGEIGKRSTVERARLTIDEVNKLLDDLSREGKLCVLCIDTIEKHD